MTLASPIYAGLLALLFVWLSFRVVAARRRHGVSVGDGGEKEVIKAMRTHSNCAEYAPFGIVLLALAELQGLGAGLVHVLGLMLLAGRLLHAYGFGRTPQVVPARKWGMYLTISALVLGALANIGLAII